MSYTNDFFVQRRTQTILSASRILDLLWEILYPESVLDVGCATGIWLAEIKRKGAHSVLGIDGHWVPRQQLEITESEFFEHNIATSSPSDIERFDIAFCIEVAEHLPPAEADRLIEFLSSCSDAVLFSAAIPGQGGTGHLNEQWQSYWYKKFQHHGFVCYDLIRPTIWHDPTINVIYKQNMLLYARDQSTSFDKLNTMKPTPERISSSFELDRIHPDLFTLRLKQAQRSVKERLLNALFSRYNKIVKRKNQRNFPSM